MASARDIQSRIKSVQDTMKITNAMYLISSTKVKKARRALTEALPHFEQSEELIAEDPAGPAGAGGPLFWHRGADPWRQKGVSGHQRR